MNKRFAGIQVNSIVKTRIAAQRVRAAIIIKDIKLILFISSSYNSLKQRHFCLFIKEMYFVHVYCQINVVALSNI